MRYFHTVSALCFLTIAGSAMAAVPDDTAKPGRAPLINPFTSEDCEQLACRPDGKSYIVKGSDNEDIKVNIPRSPYVTRDGTLVIFPNETLTVEFLDTGPVIGVPKFLSGDSDVAPTGNRLTASYELKIEDGKQMTYLYLRQGTGKILKLDALMSRPSAQGLNIRYTTTCPIRGARNTEFWEGPYYAILLRNFRYLDDNATLDCEAPEGQ